MTDEFDFDFEDIELIEDVDVQDVLSLIDEIEFHSDRLCIGEIFNA